MYQWFSNHFLKVEEDSSQRNFLIRNLRQVFLTKESRGERSVDSAPYSKLTLIFLPRVSLPHHTLLWFEFTPSLASYFWTLFPLLIEVFYQAGEALGVRPHLEEVGHLGDRCLEDDIPASFLSHPCFLSAPCSQRCGLSNFCCDGLEPSLWTPSCSFCLVVGHIQAKSLAVPLATFWKLPLYKVAFWNGWILHL